MSHAALSPPPLFVCVAQVREGGREGRGKDGRRGRREEEDGMVEVVRDETRS